MAPTPSTPAHRPAATVPANRRSRPVVVVPLLVFRSVMSESPCRDDSALSPRMIRPFREIVSVWTKVRPAGFRTFCRCAKDRKQGLLVALHDLSRRAQPSRPRSASPAGRDPMTGPGPAIAVSPARAVAYAVLRRVFEQEAWADRALHGEARRAGLDARDRALATQLSYGAVQRAATLDHVIEALAQRPVARLEPAGARRAAPRGLPAGVPGRRRARTPRSPSPSSWPRRTRRAAPGW